jgi:predicted transcriptional regulator
VKRFSKGEMLTICLLRHKTAKRIIEALLHRNELSHCKLASEVAISSQALTWQMKTLRNTEFVLQVNDGIRTVYSLNKASTSMLEKYLAIVA